MYSHKYNVKKSMKIVVDFYEIRDRIDITHKNCSKSMVIFHTQFSPDCDVDRNLLYLQSTFNIKLYSNFEDLFVRIVINFV